MAKSTTSGTTIKRIHREIADLGKEDMGGMSLAPNEGNLFEWRGAIPGPAESPYEGGLFNISVELAPDYPFSAPKVTFLTRIYHMNISDRGGVCIDLLKHNWSPALSLYKVLLSLSSLLTDPNPNDPLVPTIASTYRRNRKEHDSTAQKWTQLYALPPKATSDVKDVSQTAEAKGKGKATALISSSSTSQEPNNRTRGATRTSSRRKAERAETTNEVISLLSDTEDSDNINPAEGTRKSLNLERTREKRRRGTDGEGGSQVGRSKVRRLDVPGTLDDVIVIED